MQLGPRYRLLERLGAGSTARVYRAQAADGPTCILKIGHGTANGPSLALEAFHAHLVDSPRSPVLLALGRVCVEPSEREAVRDDDGLPALAFADRPGEPMSSVPLDLGSLSRVMRDLAEALEHLHGVGLAHGDLKPANVLVGERGAGLLDLGSVRRLLDEDVAGATPRYLGLGDATLGDARHRDLLALGLLVAEGLSPEVRSAEHPLSVARRLATTTPLHRLVRALLVPEPTARPAASWVVRQLSQATKIDTHQDPTSGSRQLRASYLRLRLADLGSDAVAETVASWARPAQSIVLAAHALCQSLGMEPPGALPPRRDGVLLPLDGDARLRWLASLVGTSASTWQPVLAGYEEQTLERAFDVLAESRSPRTFTLPLVAAALRGERPTPNHALEAERVDVETTVRIAYQLGQSPPAAEVLEAIERHAATLPRSILLDAAEALRLRGETARALRLLENRADDSATIAELLRRSGELEASRRVAEHVLGLGSDEAQRAAAIVARLALDANDLERAGSLVADARTAPLLEVAALVAHRRGDASEAARLATEGRALAANDEQRARLAATLAYVMHPAEPSTTLALFAEAAEHALRAGAVLEEASYRTGEASSALDLGRFDDAERASGRAILLFEDVLGRPGLAARAWLARASMWSSIGATEEAVESIAEVLLRAGQDPRARRFALFARCDVLEPEAHEAARDARSLVPPSLLESAARGTSDLHTVPDDDLRALARLLRHVPELELALRDLDAIVATRPKVVRLEWLHARIEQLLRSPSRDTENARRTLEAAAALIESDQFSSGYLRTMHTARGLARWLSAPELEARFEHARRTAAQVFLTRVPPERSELARKLPWLEADARPLPDGATLIDGPAVARLVRSLGEREDVLGLLTRVLDVLLEWTGAERGMLLLRRPSGALVPRAARRLSRGDLGGDQRAVSTTLAERALREGVPVVAVDAESELGDTHASIHALALRSVLVVPLVARGEPIGVVYLDDRIRRGAFGAREVAWAQTVAPIAAVAIADARKQRALDRALRRNERAQLALERELSQKEHVLEAARAELSRTMSRHIRRHADDEIIGESPPIQRLLGLCDRISATEVPVLIQGESGTGKELVARAIHRNGSRSGGPFVSENCGALPETLLESALFGHVRGAFTGATRTHVGLLEAADRGTLFLDEIGEMSLSMQTKLLRVLEDGIVRPVGSERGRRVDLRLVAATHRDLDEMVAAGRFREDLLYRLDVLRMRVPPLRERREDIPLLVRHFLARYAGESRTVVSPAALERLVAFDWPGNVRQLENEVRRAIVLSDGVIDAEHLALGRTTVLRPTGDLTIRPRVDALEATLIEEAMRRTGGNQTRSAELLGMSRFGLRKLMKRLGIGA